MKEVELIWSLHPPVCFSAVMDVPPPSSCTLPNRLEAPNLSHEKWTPTLTQLLNTSKKGWGSTSPAEYNYKELALTHFSQRMNEKQGEKGTFLGEIFSKHISNRFTNKNRCILSLQLIIACFSFSFMDNILIL